ncbi:BEN domain-containing protein 2 isoform X1 [Bufo bufo]|uniref:BEN domain-containing protein 2 isoform X1 n=2 Tax=Bufo bufo TaxID=8384 RepID=UPI001ABEE341|nr:BEN domain-containing protein 2 isoform X1 [Bufo bufo]
MQSDVNTTEELEFRIPHKRRKASNLMSDTTMGIQGEEYDDVNNSEYDYEAEYENASIISDVSYSGEQLPTLTEVLSYCQAMYEMVLRLDKKMDLLQRKVSEMYHVRMKPHFKSRQVSLHPRGAQPLPHGHIRFQKLNQRIPSSLILQRPRNTPSHPRKPDEQRRLCHQSTTGPSLSPPIEREQAFYRSSPPLPTIVSTHSLQSLITVSDEENREVKIETLPESTCSPPPVITAPLATSSMGHKTTGATIAEIEPLLVPCIPVQQNITSEELPSSSVQLVPVYEFLGDPSRNIKVPGSVLMKAKQKTQAKYAARYLVRALFSKEALSSARGKSVQGLMALDANKVVAIREFLASEFPECDVGEDGKDWKTCVTNVNAMIRCLHLEAKKSTVNVYPKATPQVPDDSICLDSDDATEEDNAVEVPDDVHTVPPDTLKKQKDNRSPSAQKMRLSGKQKASDPIEHFGETWRNVLLPFSVIYIGKGKSRPELSARYLIRHLFPEEILVKSNVYGNVERGVLPLDSNRIAALRDFLQQNYPAFDLKENGQDWKACVAAINSTIRSLRHDQKKASLQSRKRTSLGIMDHLF